MEFFILALIMGMIPAYIASAKGKNFLLWWFYGTVLFAFAIIHAIVMKPAEKNLIYYGMRYCPHCDKPIKLESTNCHFCNGDVQPLEIAED